jgi:hypothetical protein
VFRRTLSRRRRVARDESALKGFSLLTTHPKSIYHPSCSLHLHYVSVSYKPFPYANLCSYQQHGHKFAIITSLVLHLLFSLSNPLSPFETPQHGMCSAVTRSQSPHQSPFILLMKRGRIIPSPADRTSYNTHQQILIQVPMSWRSWLTQLHLPHRS